MCKLKVDKKKKFKMGITYTAVVESVNALNSHLLPLSSSLNFDFFFSILPDIISNNIPVFFFTEYSKFSSSFYIVSLYFSY